VDVKWGTGLLTPHGLRAQCDDLLTTVAPRLHGPLATTPTNAAVAPKEGKKRQQATGTWRGLFFSFGRAGCPGGTDLLDHPHRNRSEDGWNGCPEYSSGQCLVVLRWCIVISSKRFHPSSMSCVFAAAVCVESRNSEVWVEAYHRSNIVILVFTYLDFHVRSDPIY
jgi:hypothetical protein